MWPEPRPPSSGITSGLVNPPSSPDPDPLLRIHPQPVRLARGEGGVELVEIAHDVRPELRRAVRVDGEVLLLLLLAALRSPAVGPVQEEPLRAGQLAVTGHLGVAER